MNEFFENLLFWHVMLGVFGVILFYIILILIFKKNRNIKKIKELSFSGFIFFILSWISGGVYYVQYYGSKVKPIIISGGYSFAHKVFMESKEHIFLFLPFLSLIVFLIFHFENEKINYNKKIFKPLVVLVGLVVFLGTVMALFGIMISGAVR